MELPLVIIFLGFLIFFTHFLNSVFDRIRIPNALILLLIGLIIGPVSGLVNQEQFGAIGPIFTNITLVILLFESGVNLDIRSIGKSIGSATLLTVFNFILSAAAATFIAYHFTSIDDWLGAAFFGSIIGGTSSAIVIPMIKQLNMTEDSKTILLLESALSDVLCLVIGLGLLSAMKDGSFEASSLLIKISLSFILAAIIGFVSGMLWSIYLNRIRKLENNTFLNLAMVFIVSGLTDLVGLNGGIATLVFGITLGNAHLLKLTQWGDLLHTEEILKTEKEFFSEVVFILQTYFFVYVGVSLRFGQPIIFLIGFLIVLLILFFRLFSVKFFIKKSLPYQDLKIMSIMTPKGLVPAILASLPLQLGLYGGDVIQDMSYAIVLFSILLCALLVFLINKRPSALGLYRFILAPKAGQLHAAEKLKEEITGADSVVKQTNGE